MSNMSPQEKRTKTSTEEGSTDKTALCQPYRTSKKQVKETKHGVSCTCGKVRGEKVRVFSIV